MEGLLWEFLARLAVRAVYDVLKYVVKAARRRMKRRK